MEALATYDVCVETCLTSNLMSSSCSAIAEHPVHAFIRHQVPFVLCSDNPEVHGKTLTDEYELFVTATGRYDLISQMYATQLRYSFS